MCGTCGGSSGGFTSASRPGSSSAKPSFAPSQVEPDPYERPRRFPPMTVSYSFPSGPHRCCPPRCPPCCCPPACSPRCPPVCCPPRCPPPCCPTRCQMNRCYMKPCCPEPCPKPGCPPARCKPGCCVSMKPCPPPCCGYTGPLC